MSAGDTPDRTLTSTSPGTEVPLGTSAAANAEVLRKTRTNRRTADWVNWRMSSVSNLVREVTGGYEQTTRDRPQPSRLAAIPCNSSLTIPGPEGTIRVIESIAKRRGRTREVNGDESRV